MAEPADDRTIDLRECLNAMLSSHVGRCLLQGCLHGLKDKEWCQYCGQHMGKPNPPPMGLLGQSPIQVSRAKDPPLTAEQLFTIVSDVSLWGCWIRASMRNTVRVKRDDDAAFAQYQAELVKRTRHIGRQARRLLRHVDAATSGVR